MRLAPGRCPEPSGQEKRIGNALGGAALSGYDRAMPERRRRSDWSRPLPRPLAIPTVMQLETLADVRVLIEKHLPKDRRKRTIA